ncbi:hypothetical protein C2G38_909808 [Gigaspora rosea]|uniref:Uncharacterized protein n=1 Tax=Gigaspora rosea TaxID=44941 RepID=A0A397VSU4_9GLOM|nr:hypothetical protein C2G38_909808 [Gigaspora rosea]
MLAILSSSSSENWISSFSMTFSNIFWIFWILSASDFCFSSFLAFSNNFWISWILLASNSCFSHIFWILSAFDPCCSYIFWILSASDSCFPSFMTFMILVRIGLVDSSQLSELILLINLRSSLT